MLSRRECVLLPGDLTLKEFFMKNVKPGRAQRIGEQIARDLAELIPQEVRDPRVGLVTITGCEVTPDYAHAKVYFTVLGSDPAASAAGLNAAAGMLRSILFKRLHIHTVPTLHFAHDQSPATPTDSEHRMKKKGDPIDGVLLFDKPEGLSSNAAMQIVRRLANAQKAGHTGTLDPMATGLLPLCFGNATKYSADLLNAEKGYEARVQLGAETDSGDRTGTVTQTFDASGVTADMVREAAAAFLGEIEQIPPMHSALKKDGQCLYTLARRGEVVEREPRRVTIHELSISDFADGAFTMKCLVSKGTYIRVLAEDIGRRLGVGAHLIGLRRTRVGYLMIDNATTLEDLRTLGTPEAVRAKLLPADTLILSLARVDLDEAGESRFLCGQRLALGLTTRGRTRVYGPRRGLLGTALVGDRGVLEPERLVTVEH